MTGIRELVQIVSKVERPEVKRQLARVRSHANALDAQLREVVKERPLAAIGAALVFGYALGRLVLRR
jgi:hypothetical protein